jgi:hypothetical protein
MGSLVTLASYARVLDARLAASRLEGAGIRAFLRDEQIVDANPLLVGAVHGVRVQVFVEDEQAAREILAHCVDEAGDEGDDGDPVPRCPNCDSEYVLAAKGDRTGAQLRCRRCKFTGPASEFTARSLAQPDGVRPPVYRLLRGAGIPGAMLGIVGGFAAGGLLACPFSPGLFAGWVFLAAVVLGPFVGRALGRRITSAVCSEPSCRAAVSLADSTCPRCRRNIAGEIRDADEHYLRIAAWRRATLADGAARDVPASDS